MAESQQAPPHSGAAVVVQMDAADTVSDISSLIGLTLEELFSRFGYPQSVYAVRGIEVWQDDVVFIYAGQDFYIYKNRVWQIEVKAAYGIKIGDPLRSVSRILGEGLTYFNDYLLFPLPSRAWPLMLRVNFDQSQAVSAIFIYRSDF
ncbi:MAG: hypothetical protein LBD29_02115 [Treponema sp.]|nr:hypothetical protein [Treponema sp.]